MATLLLVHSRFSNTIWLFFLVLGLWGLWRALRGQEMDSSYLGALVIGQILYIVQGLLGGLLYLNGLSSNLSRPGIHILYGVFAAVFLPFVYLSWLQGDTSNRGQWVMALSTLFLFGIALGGITTSL
jgi:hypothetical protein